MKKIFFLYFLAFFLFIPMSFASINYSEFFPNNWNNIFQSQSNGWASWLNNSKKEIMTPEGCVAVTSSLGQQIFIPTRTQEEWQSFKNHLPNGVSLNSCIVNAQCGESHNKVTDSQPQNNFCSAGQFANFQTTSRGWSWNCLGENGGNNVSCSSHKKFTCQEIGGISLLHFNGRVDHTMRVSVQIFSENGQGFSASQKYASELLNLSTSVGGYYQESNETYWGDQLSSVTYSPLSKAIIKNGGFQSGTISFKGVRKSNSKMQVNIIQQPSLNNNWIGIMDVFTPASGYQYLTAELYFKPNCQ